MSDPRAVEEVRALHGTLRAWSGDVITEQLRRFGAHTRNELAMVCSLIRPHDHIIDVGAHIGSFAIPMARCTGYGGRVYCFEASRETFDLLVQNIELNELTGVIAPCRAVVSEKPSRFMQHSPATDNSGMNYFLPQPGTPDPAQPWINLDTWHLQIGAPRIALIKIDVEGAEVSVLRSCRNILARDRPVLYVEINAPALANFGVGIGDVEQELRGWGYHFFRNVGARNSNHDRFDVARLPRLTSGGRFFDCLAIHPTDPRYPPRWQVQFSYWRWWLRRRVRGLLAGQSHGQSG